MSNSRYEMVVGLEVHVQLRTATKAFCRCSTRFGSHPNANTCPICLALPGALPALNETAVEYAVRASVALHCSVHPVSIFARKNYFYPDLPKGYQISQFDRPLATGGYVDIVTESGAKRVGVTRVHMEEDAGKSIHDRFPGETAIDLNRSGVPLIEIVSEPDMRSAAEASAYLRNLRRILQYLDVSDVSMEEGSLRVDANISVREFGVTLLGTKTEVKNMNSFSGVERALEVEYERQCRVVEAGGHIEQQTMLWDGNMGEVRPSRSKEGSHDYRYFPEPDLPPLVLSEEYVRRISESLPELPEARRERFAAAWGLGDYALDVLVSEPAIGNYFESVACESGDGKAAANWVMGEVLAEVNASGGELATFSVNPENLGKLIRLVAAGAVSHSAAKKIFATMVAEGGVPGEIAARDGLIQVGDQDALAGWIDEVLAENPAEAARFAGGEKKLLGVLVGLVMRKSKGSADPKLVNQMLSERIRA